MRTGWPGWSVEVSNEWSVTDDPECLTLECSDDGALQFSSAKKRDGLVTEEDLFFSTVKRTEWGSFAPVICGDFKGILYEYELEESAWLRWFLRNGSTILFVTYNGTPAAAIRERNAVEAVLRSAKIEAIGNV
jgi:hypothetical protein